MNQLENKKYLERKLAQITVFQIILILSLPTYAQLVKKIEPSQIYTWIGFSLIMAAVIYTYFYKQKLNNQLLESKIEKVDKRKSA